MSQNDHPIHFLIPKTATSGHSYSLRSGHNTRNIVYGDKSCCWTQRSGSFISFNSKYVDMLIVNIDTFVVFIVVVVVGLITY